MNARVLIVGDGHVMSRALSALVANEFLVEKIEEQQPEDTGEGFMEFFDWLAGTSKKELAILADMHQLDVEDLSAADHYKLALRVWSEM